MLLHERWLIKARSDLDLAILAHDEDKVRVFDAAIYHTQQAAEKALKGFLAFKNQKILFKSLKI